MAGWRKEKRFMRILIALLVLGTALGAMAVKALADAQTERAGILGDYFLRQYKYLEIDAAQLFWYIFKKRIRYVLLLWIAGITAIGTACAGIYMVWQGFAMGMFLGIAVLRLGIRGMFFSAAALFPQTILYLSAWVFFLQGIHVWRGATERGAYAGKGGGMPAYFLLLAGMCAVMSLGILTESYVNPWIVRQVLRIF